MTDPVDRPFRSVSPPGKAKGASPRAGLPDVLNANQQA